MKRSFKYLIIVFANFLLLFALLNLWVDNFELEFNTDAIFIETLKLIGISVLSLIALGIAVLLYQQWNIKSLKRKMVISTLIVVVMSSHFYFTYGKKMYQHQFTNREVRTSALSKIKPYEGSWFGNKAEKLTSREYKEITKVKGFPELPEEAENISFDYEYEGFLPDYSFSLTYDVPLSIRVDTMKYKDRSSSKSRSFEVVGTIKRVKYSESQW